MKGDRRRRIIVVVADDDADDRLMIREAFEEAALPVELRFVEDGEQLMDLLQRRGAFRESPSPDLILLDLNMPRKDGREALHEIKSDPTFQQIPVVVLTTSQQEEDVQRSYQLGANSFIIKPVTFDGLVEAMRAVGEYWFATVRLPPERNRLTHEQSKIEDSSH